MLFQKDLHLKYKSTGIQSLVIGQVQLKNYRLTKLVMFSRQVMSKQSQHLFPHISSSNSQSHPNQVNNVTLNSVK